VSSGAIDVLVGNTRIKDLFRLNIFNSLNLPDLTPYFSQRATEIHYFEHYLSAYKVLNRECQMFHEPHLYNSYFNHQQYWNGLSAKASMPGNYIKHLVSESFGGMSGLYNHIKCAGYNVNGSGWIVVDAPNKGTVEIKIINNDENKVPPTSLIIIDMWEHAYYIDFLYDVEAYLDTIFKLINWNVVNKRMVDAQKTFIA
jgi:Fe-Mn family superoxide dismutase